MADRSHSSRELVAIEERINSSSAELSKFIKDPAAYLKSDGIVLSDEHRKDLADTIREMQLGPRNLDKITRANRPGVGIGISIRIRF